MAKNTAQISCAITKQLHDQVAHLDQAALKAAVDTFVASQPPNPITREVLIESREQKISVNRTIQLTFNVLKTTRDEAKALAAHQGLTLSAILRRAVYEYTKPTGEDHTPENLTAMLDGWGDTA